MAWETIPISCVELPTRAVVSCGLQILLSLLPKSQDFPSHRSLVVGDFEGASADEFPHKMIAGD